VAHLFADVPIYEVIPFSDLHFLANIFKGDNVSPVAVIIHVSVKRENLFDLCQGRFKQD
jgi:hypothetical protein